MSVGFDADTTGKLNTGAQGPRLSQPYSRPSDAQSSALGTAGGSEPKEEPDSSSHRACVWSARDFSRQPAGANDRHGQSASQDRIAEPRLQHPSPRDVRTDGRRLSEETDRAASQSGVGRGKRSQIEIRSPRNSRRSAQAENHAAQNRIVRGALYFSTYEFSHRCAGRPARSRWCKFLRIVLFEACSAFTRVAACTLALSPIRDALIEGSNASC